MRNLVSCLAVKNLVELFDITVCGSFGPNKSVCLNQFNGEVYIHLRGPNKEGGQKHFTMSIKEFKELARLLNIDQLKVISNNFNLQVWIILSNSNLDKNAFIQNDADSI